MKGKVIKIAKELGYKTKMSFNDLISKRRSIVGDYVMVFGRYEDVNTPSFFNTMLDQVKLGRGYTVETKDKSEKEDETQDFAKEEVDTKPGREIEDESREQVKLDKEPEFERTGSDRFDFSLNTYLVITPLQKKNNEYFFYGIGENGRFHKVTVHSSEVGL